jgi:ABC-type glycerol-3-phosphate transport system substrate-binding protein
MKKAILILMILSMLLALAACGGGSIAGTWHIKSASNSSGSVTVEQAPELRDVMGDMVLNEDGTGSMVVMGNRYQITWDSSTITGDDGTRLSYTVSGNTLELDAQGVTYTFIR